MLLKTSQVFSCEFCAIFQNQATKFGQLWMSMRNIFLQDHVENEARRLVPDLFLRFKIFFTKHKSQRLKLQVSRPETPLKRDSNKGTFLWIFSKTLFTDRWLLLLISLLQPRFYPMITLFSFFSSLLPFIMCIRSEECIRSL